MATTVPKYGDVIFVKDGDDADGWINGVVNSGADGAPFDSMLVAAPGHRKALPPHGLCNIAVADHGVWWKWPEEIAVSKGFSRKQQREMVHHNAQNRARHN